MTGQVGRTANAKIIFPVAFPFACASVHCIRSSANAQQRGDFAESITPSSFVINNGSADNGTTYGWSEIGY
ncbi:gp53-like domain-containing protein [Laribacter hongkongensis]|uniref:gp53-like domain-containing protein n=1 Tax=Laribacter hongkongensis TaxID=168471 RepID=UPI00357164EA